MIMFRNLLIAFILVFMSMPIVHPAAAYEGERFRTEYLIQGGRLYTALQPVGENKCEGTTGLILPDPQLDKKIISEVFIPNNAGYVYWILNFNGDGVEVFFVSYIIRECVITKSTTDLRKFNDGKNTFVNAKEYYTHLVKQLLEGSK